MNPAGPAKDTCTCKGKNVYYDKNLKRMVGCADGVHCGVKGSGCGFAGQGPW